MDVIFGLYADMMNDECLIKKNNEKYDDDSFIKYKYFTHNDLVPGNYPYYCVYKTFDTSNEILSTELCTNCEKHLYDFKKMLHNPGLLLVLNTMQKKVDDLESKVYDMM